MPLLNTSMQGKVCLITGANVTLLITLPRRQGYE